MTGIIKDICEGISSLWKYYKYWIIIAFIPVLVLISMEMFKTDFFAQNDHSMSQLHAALLIIITLGIWAVACIQLKAMSKSFSSIKKSTRSEFLLRIDGRYGSQEILEARKVINEIYRNSDRDHNKAAKMIVKM